MNFLDCEISQNIDEKKFSCQVCKKTYSSKNGLNYHHKLKHDESNPNKCKICFKVFAYKSLLVIHTRVHTGEKPYVCSTCGKRFTQKNQLQTHKTTHNMERKFKRNSSEQMLG